MNYNKKYEIGINGNNVYFKNLKNNTIGMIWNGYSSERVGRKSTRKENLTLEFGYADKNGDYITYPKNVEITWYPLSSEYTVRQNDWTYEMEIVKK